jgi:hypothetical protein
MSAELRLPGKRPLFPALESTQYGCARTLAQSPALLALQPIHVKTSSSDPRTPTNHPLFSSAQALPVSASRMLKVSKRKGEHRHTWCCIRPPQQFTRVHHVITLQQMVVVLRAHPPFRMGNLTGNVGGSEQLKIGGQDNLHSR